MCGRYSFIQQQPKLRHGELTDFIIENDWPSFNIAPTDLGTVIIEKDGSPKVTHMNWGFRPHWAQKSYAKINAKSETLFDGKMFKHSALHQRCLIVADGFYEPKGPAGSKHRPWYYFRYQDNRPFTFAGIWTHFKDSDEEYDNFAILTTSPNSQLKLFHHRMPVILNDNLSTWLDPRNQNIDLLRHIIEPTEYSGLVAYRVGDAAKNPRNKDRTCIEYVEDKMNTLKTKH